MKKILSLMLALTLCLGLTAIPALAANETIPVEGYIGSQSGNPEDLIDVKVPVAGGASDWYVYETSPNVPGGKQVQSPAKTITNQSSLVDLVVKFVSYTPDAGDAATVESDLDLYLTGDLVADTVGSIDLAGGYLGASIEYTNLLKNANDPVGSVWTIGYTGVYRGVIGTATYSPTYEMVLNFAVSD